MITLADILVRRRYAAISVAVFMLLSVVVTIGSYFGWFGWVEWGRPETELPPAVAEGEEATEFAKRLLMTESRFARDDVKKIRDMLLKMNYGKEQRYSKYAQEFRYVLKREPEPITVFDVAEPTPEQQAATNAPLDQADLVDLYNMACLLDRRFSDVNRMYRSCELARVQHLALREAYEATQLVAPVHPPANLAVLRGKITSTAGEEMKRFKEEMSKIKVEIKSIVGNAMRLIDLAAVLDPGLLGFGSVWDINDADSMLHRNPTLFGVQNLFNGQTGADPRAFVHEWGRGEGPVHKKELGLPVEAAIDLSKAMPLPGRRLMAKGRTADWMFINSWYIIGAFPNPNRQNLEKKFPPESCMDPQRGFLGIDLDATYVGLGGKPVRWQYIATDSRVCFVPHKPEEWAIWYAYTEIWSETDQEKYCIFGSDDFGKCWLNGEEVFVSGLTPHPWIPDRKNAKVRFHKGFNAVLFKLENAWGRTGWSLCVYTGKVPEAKEAASETKDPSRGNEG